MKEINEPKIELHWNRKVQVEMELKELAVLYAVLGRANGSAIRGGLAGAFGESATAISDTVLPDRLYADMKKLLTKHGAELR